jgi:hypothetical protein
MSQWLEMSTGSLVVGEAAYAERFEQALPGDLVPLADFLLGTIPIENVTKPPARSYEMNMPESEFKTNGKWLLKLIQAEDKDTLLSPDVIDRAHYLGLGYSKTGIIGRFGSFHEFRRAIDAYPNPLPAGTFDSWATEDFVSNAQALLATFDKPRKPTGKDYDAWAKRGMVPRAHAIRNKIKGGINHLNSYLGFPDVRKFDEEDYLEWGVRVMRANEGRRIDLIDISVLSKRGCGPSERSVATRFDGTLNFADIVANRFETEETKNNERRQHLIDTFNSLPIEERRTDKWKAERVCSYAAKYIVAQQCLPRAKDEALNAIAMKTTPCFMAEIIKQNPNLSPGHIEVIAETAGVFDDIWQLYPNDLWIFRITPQEAAAERSHRTKTSLARRRTRAQSHKTNLEVAA